MMNLYIYHFMRGGGALLYIFVLFLNTCDVTTTEETISIPMLDRLHEGTIVSIAVCRRRDMHPQACTVLTSLGGSIDKDSLGGH